MTSSEFLFSKIDTIKGIGSKTYKLFKKKNINTIFDLLWSLPRDITNNGDIVKSNSLQIGKVQLIKVNIIKYNFPRIRNLPSRVFCEDEFGKIECIFFNSREGYIRKILPLSSTVILKGKINYFRNKYQITNPTLIKDDVNSIKNISSSYSLTHGLNQNKYNKIIAQVINNLPDLDEWLSYDIHKKFNFISWKDAIKELHKPENYNIKGHFLNRLIFDEIISTFLINSKIRESIKKSKKIKKNFDNKMFNIISKKIKFDLTIDQKKSIEEINNDLKSDKKMFRLLQGDVGCGKTIVALNSCFNVISSGFQVAMMAPTGILAKQNFDAAFNLIGDRINIRLLTGNTEYYQRKEILTNLKLGKVDMVVGTHALFQESINFKKLGLAVIDEQHKFGVRQRKKLSDKGGNNCDVLVLSATPIPRTMIMTVFGDMDTSIIKSKPKNRKEIKTYSKKEEKIDEILKFVNKQIENNNQIFWVCPLIEESKKVLQKSSVKRYEELKKIYKNKVGLIHGAMDKKIRDNVLFNFLKKKIDILVSTTVIEVGIDFPNANCIIIENANKYGLSQLHQLRGRVGRGNKESYCILMFKNNLSKNARERIQILKNNVDGFKISEEDMKLRGYGDLLGFKQSGMQSFRLADPVLNQDLFLLAEKEVRRIEKSNENIDKYSVLLKLYDRADILNDLV